MKNLKQQLKQVKQITGGINPDADFVVQTKKELFARIAHAREVTTAHVVEKNNFQEKIVFIKDVSTVFIPGFFARAMRPVATAVIALLLTTGGWVASAYAEPGDALWQAKVAVGSVIERGQLALADDTGDVTLNLKFASKRAQVIRDVSARVDVSAEKKAQIIHDTSVGIEKNIASAEKKLDSVDVHTSPDIIKDVSLKTKEITTAFKETAELEQQKEGADLALVASLNVQAENSGQKSLQMVEKVLQKKVDASQTVSDEEKLIIKDHLDTVVQTIQHDAQKAKTDVDLLATDVEKIVAQEVLDQATAVSVSSTVLTTSTVLEENVSTSSEQGAIENSATTTVDDVTSSVNTGVGDASLKSVQQKATDTVTNVAEQKTQVEQLIDVDLFEAVKKTRLLSESVSQTVKDVSTVSKEILPQIQNSGDRTLPVIVPTVNTSSTPTVRN